MSAQSAVVATSWLRVNGPQDTGTCAWCQRWIGQLVPLEMQATYGDYHAREGAGHACRCELEPEEMQVGLEDPGCQWA